MPPFLRMVGLAPSSMGSVVEFGALGCLGLEVTEDQESDQPESPQAFEVGFSVRGAYPRR